MTTEQFDLPAYLNRIGYNGPTRANYATLAGLLAAHMNAIRFENIDVLLGRPIQLDLASLQEKMVVNRRGGYCFEQATLFLAAIRAIGFDATPRTSRVILVLKPDQSPRGHMYLLVHLPEGDFIADPGLGGLACRTPIPLDGAAVREGDESFSIATDARGRVLTIKAPDRTIDAWISGFDGDNWIDFEVGNHWFATHRASPMINRLMLRAATANGRITVMNRDVTIRENGAVSTSRLNDRAELRRLVAAHLGFDCPEIETLRVPMLPEWK
jgi:N-hydroxyarylamine O-acetyltransferase